jgi:hypothetical protein
VETKTLEEEDDQPTERSVIAKEVSSLQETVLRLARDRERLPQPLFWSLFNSRLKDIKRNKEEARALKAALGETLDL